MPEWIAVSTIEACPPGTSIEVVAGDRIVAIYNVDGQIAAMDGVCPHQGGPLGKGTLNGCIVTCPWHGWQFDVTTGQSQLSNSVTHPTLAVRVDKGRIYVSL